jgi:hypothetical protein
MLGVAAAASAGIRLPRPPDKVGLVPARIAPHESAAIRPDASIIRKSECGKGVQTRLWNCAQGSTRLPDPKRRNSVPKNAIHGPLPRASLLTATLRSGTVRLSVGGLDV